jgi:hypothetical protein
MRLGLCATQEDEKERAEHATAEKAGDDKRSRLIALGLTKRQARKRAPRGTRSNAMEEGLIYPAGPLPACRSAAAISDARAMRIVHQEPAEIDPSACHLMIHFVHA